MSTTTPACNERVRNPAWPVGWATVGHQWREIVHETVSGPNLYAHDCGVCTECDEIKCQEREQ